MSGIPTNVIPANVNDITNNLVSGTATQAQQLVAETVTSAVGGVTGTAQQALSQAQAKATEELNSLAQQLQLPPDALASLAILSTIFSYEQLRELSIEDIKKQIKSIKLTFKLTRPELPEIPDLSIPSTAEIIDKLIPSLPNESGLSAYGEQLLNTVKQLRQAAQSRFETDAANQAKNMFQLRQNLIQQESQKLLSGILNKINLPPVL